MSQPSIAVAVSGGVDSLVAGHLISKRFEQVFGLHFVTGYETARLDPRQIETQLGFPVHTVDLSEKFESSVVQYLVKTYLSGKTPNPCLICNTTIKFGALLEHALKMGADYLATGHYATAINALSCKGNKAIMPYLKIGKDPVKDQSYFLSMLSCEQLERVFFPLADMTKPQVVAYARTHGLEPIHTKESQDICFIQDEKLNDFISKRQHIAQAPGPIKDICGNIIGHHNGLFQFTIGQRRGINCPASEPYYVKALDIKNNTLIVSFKKDLNSTVMSVENIIWNDDRQGMLKHVLTKIRYNHPGAMSTITLDDKQAIVQFESPVQAVTPGQAAVFYSHGRVLGAGIIK